MRGKSWRRAARPGEPGTCAGVLPSRALRLALPLLTCLGILFVWALAASTLPVIPEALASGNGQVQIVTPQPDSNNDAQGPVGAYVTISAQNLNAQDSYSAGVAVSPAGCGAQFISVTDQPIQPDSSGSLATTFVWPSAAGAVGSSYFICLQDASQGGGQALQSAGVYTVRAGSAPSITLKAPPASSTPGTQAPIPPQAPNQFYAGSAVAITGRNFVPGGQPLSVYLATQKITSPSQFQSAQQLQTTDNAPITADNNGSFTTTVTLPATPGSLPGSYYVYVVSQDTQNGTTLPSLIAEKGVTLLPQPVPTPTATVAPPTATPNSTPSGTSTPGSSSGGPHNLGAVIGLGVVSVLLFVMGVILLASAAAMPRGPQR